MKKYVIWYKEWHSDWRSTRYTGNLTKEELVEFFGLKECEDYSIEEIKDDER